MISEIKSRCTCFEFSEKAPSKENILSILDAGRMAPSSHNSQDWKFIVVRNKVTISKLMADCTYGVFHTNPAVIIALVADPLYETNKQGLLSKRLLSKAQYHKYLNTAFAADHMVLTAENLGINSAILSPTIESANKVLKVPKKSETLLCIGLGYKKEGAYFPEKERKKLGEVARYETYKGGEVDGSI